MTGPGCPFGDLTKRVLESALKGEMDAHLGYSKHEQAGRDGGNSRNGTRTKTVIADIGTVEIDVPRRLVECWSMSGAVRDAPLRDHSPERLYSLARSDAYGAPVDRGCL